VVAISVTSYATPSAQAYQSQTRLEQARREADQAESYAKQLRAQADDAEQTAQSEQGKVTTLSAQVAQTESTYSRQLSNAATAAEVTNAQQVLVPVATVAANKFSFPSNPLKSYASSTAIGQLLGQRSGRFVNVTA
jgi:hypothetical protein